MGPHVIFGQPRFWLCLQEYLRMRPSLALRGIQPLKPASSSAPSPTPLFVSASPLSPSSLAHVLPTLIHLIGCHFLPLLFSITGSYPFLPLEMEPWGRASSCGYFDWPCLTEPAHRIPLHPSSLHYSPCCR